MYSIVIPTNRSFENAQALWESIFGQNKLPDEVVVVLDSDDIDHKDYYANVQKLSDNLFEKIPFELNIISPKNFTDFKSGKGASFVRNYGIGHTKSHFVAGVDDDNQFDEDFFSKLLTQAKYLSLKGLSNFVIVPTEIYKGSVRSMGYGGFNHLICRPVKTRFDEDFFQKNNGLGQIEFCSSNCFLATRALFDEFKFDEELLFVYEDFLFFRQINSKYKIFCSEIQTNHNMRSKTKLEDLYISSEFLAYQKSRNRILLVCRTSNTSQKILFFSVGLWLHTLYLIRNIVYLADPKFKTALIKSVIRGIKDGISACRISKKKLKCNLIWSRKAVVSFFLQKF